MPGMAFISSVHAAMSALYAELSLKVQHALSNIAFHAPMILKNGKKSINSFTIIVFSSGSIKIQHPSSPSANHSSTYSSMHSSIVVSPPSYHSNTTTGTSCSLKGLPLVCSMSQINLHCASSGDHAAISQNECCSTDISSSSWLHPGLADSSLHASAILSHESLLARRHKHGDALLVPATVRLIHTASVSPRRDSIAKWSSCIVAMHTHEQHAVGSTTRVSLDGAFDLIDLVAKPMNRKSLDPTSPSLVKTNHIPSGGGRDSEMHAVYHTQWLAVQPAQDMCHTITDTSTLLSALDDVMGSCSMSRLDSLLQVLQQSAIASQFDRWKLATDTLALVSPMAISSTWGGRDASCVAALHAMLKVARFESILSQQACISYSHLTCRNETIHSDVDASAQISSVCFMPMLVPQSNNSPEQFHSASLYKGKNVAITGAFGGLGMLVSRWLIHQGAAHAVLLGRRPYVYPTGAEALIDAHWTAMQMDVSFHEDTMPLHEMFTANAHHPIEAVLHIAGAIHDASIPRQSPVMLNTAMAPKLNGLSNIHNTLSCRYPVQSIGVFSSIAGVLATAGQCNYAAANAALDSKVTVHALQGVQYVGIQWGAWSDAGMASKNPLILQRLRSKGYLALSPTIGLHLMSQILTTTNRPVVVMASLYDTTKFLQHQIRSSSTAFFFKEMLSQENRASVDSTALCPAEDNEGTVVSHPRVITATSYTRESIAHQIEVTVHGIVGNQSAAGNQLDHDAPLMDVGLDSIGTVELRNALAERFANGVTFSATMVFEYPTINALAGYIFEAISSDSINRTGQQQGSQQVIASSYSIDDDTVDHATSYQPRSLSHHDIESIVAGLVAEVLEISSSTTNAFDIHQPFTEAGLDSIAAVELRNMIAQQFNIEQSQLSATLIYDYPSVIALTDYLTTDVLVDALSQSNDRSLQSISHHPDMNTYASGCSSIDSTAIVVTGVGCAFPQQANSPHQFFNSITTRRMESDLTQSIPVSKWDIDKYYSPDQEAIHSMYCRFAAMIVPTSIAYHASFDAEFFRLTQNEAMFMDPHARHLLVQVHHALIDSYAARRIHTYGGARALASFGTFVGCMWSTEYIDHVLPELGIDPKNNSAAITGNTFPFMVGRIAYTYNMQGPCVPTDTACSSSMVAAHTARSSLMQRECAAAAVAGVNLMLSPATSIKISALHALSPVGRCKTFDAAADGYGRGEGAAAFILERLEDFYHVRDTAKSITALFAGSAINTAGRSSGLTAPSGPAQRQLVASALADAKRGPEELSVIAVHGTGTSLGDPIEVGALGQVVSQRNIPIVYSSVKSHYGHTEGCAGVAGALLAIQSLNQTTATPVLHLRHVNPYVSQALGTNSRAAVHGDSSGITSLPRQMGCLPFCALAGTSSFGMSGINAHGLFVGANHDAYHDGTASTMNDIIIGNSSHLQYCWPVPLSHPLVHSVVVHTINNSDALRSKTRMRFECYLHGAPSLSFVHDHIVHNSILVPATVFVEMMMASLNPLVTLLGSMVNSTKKGPHDLALSNLSIQAPMVLSQGSLEDTSHVIVCTIDGDAMQISSENDDNHTKSLHVSAQITTAQHDFESSESAVYNSITITNKGTLNTVLATTIPTASLQRSQSLMACTPVYTAQLLRDPIHHSDYCAAVHPACTDASLHLGAVSMAQSHGIGGSSSSAAAIPIGIQCVAFNSSLANSMDCFGACSMWAKAEQPRLLAMAHDDKNVLSSNHSIALPTSLPFVLTVSGLTSKVVQSTQLKVKEASVDSRSEFTYYSAWQTSNSASMLLHHGCIAAPSKGILCTTDNNCVYDILPIPSTASNAATLLSLLQQFLSATIQHSQHSSTAATLHALCKADFPHGGHGHFLAPSFSSVLRALDQAFMMASMLKVACIENPRSLHASVYWDDPLGNNNHPSFAATDVLDHFSLFGVVRCSNSVLVPRLLRYKKNGVYQNTTASRNAVDCLSPFSIVAEPRGSLGNLLAVQLPEIPVLKFEEGQRENNKDRRVMIKVLSIGLNFRDVLNVLGMYPGDPGPPGSDFCGRIVSFVDSDSSNSVASSDYAIGDVVFGQASGCLGSHVIASTSTLAHASTVNASFNDAASLPTIYLTALASLVDAASLRSKETVLIHAATGGLGLAGVQVASSINASVLGTAGQPSKRSYLRSIKPSRGVLDSRSVRFLDDAVTLQASPNVVLNSLTSPGMVAASLAVLQCGGRFVEVAKRDIWSTERVQQERPDVAFSTLAVDFMPPSVVRKGLRDVSAMKAAGRIVSLQLLEYSLGNTAGAMRQLSAARHIGKVILRGQRDHSDHAGAGSSNAASERGAWVITGGTGALGAMAAHHLMSNSAASPGACVLLSRTGKSSSLPRPLIDSCAGMVCIHMGDVSAKDDASSIQHTWAADRHVCGVLHAGGVVHDGLIGSQSMRSLRSVIAPKAEGSTNALHNQCMLPLHNVALFSSVASAFGSGGQINYAAANSCIDALGQTMNIHGLPGCSIHWGAWSGAGMAAHAGLERMERLGVGAIAPSRGVAVLWRMLGELHVGSLPSLLVASIFIWEKYLTNAHVTGLLSSSTSHDYYMEFADGSAARSNDKDVQTNTVEIADQIASNAVSIDALLETVSHAVAMVLGQSVDENQPLVATGVDSLGALLYSICDLCRCRFCHLSIH